MGNLVNISAAIVNVLQSVKQNNQSAFAQILTYPSVEFTGLPAATVAPSDTESDYQTIVSNLRTYTFQVDLYNTMQFTGDGPAVAFTTMLTLVDTVLDAFDNSDSLANTTQILIPTPSAWSVIETTTGVMLSARIVLHAKMSVNSNNG